MWVETQVLEAKHGGMEAKERDKVSAGHTEDNTCRYKVFGDNL